MIYRHLDKLQENYDKFEVPSLLMRACKKYPQHKVKIYGIMLLRDSFIFILFVYILFFISNYCQTCIPSMVCKPYIDMFNPLNETFKNISTNISIEDLIK